AWFFDRFRAGQYGGTPGRFFGHHASRTEHGSRLLGGCSSDGLSQRGAPLLPCCPGQHCRRLAAHWLTPESWREEIDGYTAELQRSQPATPQGSDHHDGSRYCPYCCNGCV